MTLTRSKSSTETPEDVIVKTLVEESTDSESDYVLSEEECEKWATAHTSDEESEEESDIELTDGSDSDCEITNVVTKDEKAEKINLVEDEDEDEDEDDDDDEDDDIQGWYKEWSELDKWGKIAADALGFTEESWLSESRYMNDFIREWEDITEEEKGYLLVLGMYRDNWNIYLDILDEDEEYDEEYRQDPNDNKYYTYDEFVDWYGTDYIWKRMDPKMVMYRRALRDTYGFANTLSPTLQKEYIDLMMKTF